MLSSLEKGLEDVGHVDEQEHDIRGPSFGSSKIEFHDGSIRR